MRRWYIIAIGLLIGLKGLSMLFNSMEAPKKDSTLADAYSAYHQDLAKAQKTFRNTLRKTKPKTQKQRLKKLAKKYKRVKPIYNRKLTLKELRKKVDAKLKKKKLARAKKDKKEREKRKKELAKKKKAAEEKEKKKKLAEKKRKEEERLALLEWQAQFNKQQQAPPEPQGAIAGSGFLQYQRPTQTPQTISGGGANIDNSYEQIVDRLLTNPSEADMTLLISELNNSNITVEEFYSALERMRLSGNRETRRLAIIGASSQRNLVSFQFVSEISTAETDRLVHTTALASLQKYRTLNEVPLMTEALQSGSFATKVRASEIIEYTARTFGQSGGGEQLFQPLIPILQSLIDDQGTDERLRTFAQRAIDSINEISKA